MMQQPVPGTLVFKTFCTIDEACFEQTYVDRQSKAVSRLILGMSLFLSSAFAVGADGGSLMGILQTAPTSVDLSVEGTIDWTHWGLTNETSFDRKNGVVSQISNFTLIGSEEPKKYNSAKVDYSWSDGMPTPSVSSTSTGVRLFEVGSGFQLTVPADTTDKILKLYVGVKKGRGRLEARLSDSSADPYVTFVEKTDGRTTEVVTLDFRAASADASLIVDYTVDSVFTDGSHIRLESAALTASGSGGNEDVTDGDSSGDSTDDGGSDDGTSNSVPTAKPDSATTDEGTSVIIDVLANDSGLDDTPLTVGISGSPSDGAASMLSDDMIEYTPDGGFSGEDSFLYTVTDADGDLAVASVTINVTCVTCSSDFNLMLAWDPNPGSDKVLGYRVYTGATPSTTTTLISDLSIASGDVTAQAPSVDYTAADLQLNSGDTVCFSVTAYNRVGESGFAAPTCAEL